MLFIISSNLSEKSPQQKSKSVDELWVYLNLDTYYSKKAISKMCISQYSKNYNLDAPCGNQVEYLVIDFELPNHQNLICVVLLLTAVFYQLLDDIL